MSRRQERASWDLGDGSYNMEVLVLDHQSEDALTTVLRAQDLRDGRVTLHV
jgi:hypothetical protein